MNRLFSLTFFAALATQEQLLGLGEPRKALSITLKKDKWIAYCESKQDAKSIRAFIHHVSNGKVFPKISRGPDHRKGESNGPVSQKRASNAAHYRGTKRSIKGARAFGY